MNQTAEGGKGFIGLLKPPFRTGPERRLFGGRGQWEQGIPARPTVKRSHRNQIRLTLIARKVIPVFADRVSVPKL